MASVRFKICACQRLLVPRLGPQSPWHTCCCGKGHVGSCHLALRHCCPCRPAPTVTVKWRPRLRSSSHPSARLSLDLCLTIPPALLCLSSALASRSVGPHRAVCVAPSPSLLVRLCHLLVLPVRSEPPSLITQVPPLLHDLSGSTAASTLIRLAHGPLAFCSCRCVS
jgi:hypothetical protein